MKIDQLCNLFLALLVSGVSGVLCAQTQNQQYRLHSYNREQGLDQSQVKAILQDDRRSLWVAMQGGGISSFDGLHFHNYREKDGLLGNDVGDMCMDKDGVLWIGCDQRGLSAYDGQSFRGYGPEQGVYFATCNATYCAENNDIWVGTSGDGIYVWDRKAFRHYHSKDGFPTDTTYCFFSKSVDTMWVGTTNGILEIVGGKWKRLDPQQYLNPPAGTVNAVLRRKNGTIIGTDSKNGLWQFRNGQFEYDSILKPLGEVYSLLEDAEGKIWAGGGSSVAFVNNGVLNQFDGNAALKKVKTNCILQDAHGNIWIGTEGGGMTKFSEEPFTLYGPNTPFATRAVFCVLEAALDYYLVGTEVGLFEMKGGEINPATGFPLPEAYILDLKKDVRGDIYILTDRGILRLRDGKYETVKGPNPSGTISGRNLSLDEQGRVLTANSKGIFRMDPDSARLDMLPAMKLNRESYHVYVGQGQTRYLTTAKSGVYRIRGEEIRNFSSKKELANDHVVSFLEDRNGAAWIGTYSGLVCIKPDGQYCSLEQTNGLSGDIIYIILQDQFGDLWVGTDFGLSRVNLDAKSEVVSIRNYGSEDGFVGLECNQGAACMDSQGKLWFGNIEGLACYYPTRDHFNPRPPYLELTDMQIHLREVDWKKRGFQTSPWNHLPIDPILSPEENHIRFEFAGITQHLPEKVKFRYRLLGLDSSYTDPSTENHAVYPFLPAGKYTFELLGCNAEGVWSKEPLRFHFVIKTPFYRTIWFGLVAFLVTILIVVAIVRYRTSALEKQRAMLEKKVRQRTEALEQANQVKSEFLAKMSHEIRTPMNGVIGMTDLLERTPLTPQQRKFVENIRVSGQNLLGLINDILDFSRIESGKIELEEIPFEMRHLIEEVMDILAFSAFSKDLELLYWVDPEIRGPVLGDPARIKQILINLIGNAIKFTAKGEIMVNAWLVKADEANATIKISVRDSGIGIPKEKHATLFESFTQVDASTTRKYGGTGLGLAISYNLSKMMGGQMWVESETGKGTEFFFTFLAGVSDPWKLPGESHPATSLEGKKVVVAMQNAPTISLLKQYLDHWKMKADFYDSFEAATDAAFDDQQVDFLLIDLRMAHGDPSAFAKRLASTCSERKIRFALYAEPDIAIMLQNEVGENGWVLSKPLKRDDLLQALMGLRAAAEVFDPGDQTIAFAAKFPLQILVAEDNPINQDVAEGMLGSLGYTVSVAVNGKEAVEFVTKSQVDVIFMDVQMPIMDGLEATHLIRSRHGQQRFPIIVAMTANAMESDPQRCLEAGMDTYISKPFMMGELMKVLRLAYGMIYAEEMAEHNPLETTEIPVQDATAEVVSSASSYRLTDMGMLDTVSGGEPTFVLGILKKLVVKLPEAVEEIRSAIAAEDWETVRATSHRTKSSAAYSGSEELKDKFRILENMARDQQDLESMPQKLQELAAFVDEVVEELQRHIAERTK